MIKTPPYKIGMVFGVFDGLHPGHHFFLDSASELCEMLVVVVAQDEVVERVKKHAPRHSHAQRVADIESYNPKLRVVSGDKAIRTWTVLKKHAPDIIFLGHDQVKLAAALEDIKQPFVMLAAHYPEKYKSSLLHNNKHV
jgi:cytidyltransferase-like protein